MRVLAIDPGNTESGYALIDSETCKPLLVGKVPNEDLLRTVRSDAIDPDAVAIEMVASYGMPVGEDVFETVVWIGRFEQAVLEHTDVIPARIKRGPVKMHHCHTTAAKDSNIVQALVDRFASGQPNKGKGTKAAPGWFYGFAADMWQAYALAVKVADDAEQRAAA